MQVKSRVQARQTPMFDQILCRPERPEILIALPNCLVLAAPVAAIGHQDGNLRAQFRQFERTWTVLVGRSVSTLR